jgi:hypothetical protein
MTPTGSRRTDEVKSFIYSPVARPSSTRAAPAKNRIWSTMGGSSSLMVSAFGLPVFSASTSTSFWAFCSIVSAIRSRYRIRSLGVVSRQTSSNALFAAWSAASTSSGPDSGAVAYTSPVEGLITSVVWPLLAGTSSPLTKFRNSFFSLMAHLDGGTFGSLWNGAVLAPLWPAPSPGEASGHRAENLPHEVHGRVRVQECESGHRLALPIV